tara:strand:- start:4944 stop:5198 length:255 start_codon:yes stop_codon:yes gene_type:complete
MEGRIMETYYKIEKNIPMPKAKYGNNVYDFVENMEVGDSFVINSETKANEIHKYLEKVHKIKLTKRFAGDWMGHANLWRLWRVE